MHPDFWQPAILIKVNPSTRGTVFRVQSRRGGPEDAIEVRTSITKDDWKNWRISWQEDLNQFRDILEPADSTLLYPTKGGRSLEALEILHKKGEALFQQMAGSNAQNRTTGVISSLDKARQMMTEVLGHDLGFDYGAERFVDRKTQSKTVHPPLVVIQCSDEDLFPWETLPWLPVAASEPVSLSDLARCFLAFCAITFRSNGKIPRVETGKFSVDLDRGQRLSVTSYVGANLDSPRELRFLDQLGHVKGRPWTSSSRLAPKHNISCWSIHAFRALKQKGGIHHFAAHGDASGNKGHHIRLLPGMRRGKASRTNKLKEHVLLLDALAKQIFMAGKTPPSQRNEPSLVFLNLCSSAVLRGRWGNSDESLPAMVRHLGHSACIVTEARVGDDFAAAFAERFYAAFLHGIDKNHERALTAGEALLWAKWHFLRLYHNPQGLLYSLRGRPEIRVRQPVPYVFPR